METTIWILKGLLATLFTLIGMSKIFLPKAKLLNNGMQSLVNLEPNQIKGIGILEVLGAMGLILPGLVNIYPLLSGIAALCLGLTMVVAARMHQQLKLPVAPNLVILAICLFVAYHEMIGF
ncbi:MAG: DoxX family protein [Saprospiraceae bacterium]|nr:DoxX family protein [Saprospiraceae bacterium]